MSDNIPFEIQMEIIKKVFDVKSLIQFRSVSKPWKSFIDSSDFIKGYGARHTQPHSFILRYKPDYHNDKVKYIRLVEDDNSETFKVQQQELAPFAMSPLLINSFPFVFGACHGLLCLYGLHKGHNQWMVVIWNPSIGKSFGIAVPRPSNRIHYGFGVCPITIDPTVVRIECFFNKPWHVEVFTLSSGVWNVIPSGNMPRQTITLNTPTQVVIDRYIYWGARETTFTNNGESTTNHMIVSFDLITKEFKVVDLTHTLTNGIIRRVSISKLRESLVVYGCILVEGAVHFGAWVMEHDSSFRKLFTIDTPFYKILGFRKNGETIFEAEKDQWFSTLNVSDPCSQQIKNLGIAGATNSFFMGSYKESLLLLNHSHIYYENNLSYIL